MVAIFSPRRSEVFRSIRIPASGAGCGGAAIRERPLPDMDAVGPFPAAGAGLISSPRPLGEGSDYDVDDLARYDDDLFRGFTLEPFLCLGLRDNVGLYLGRNHRGGVFLFEAEFAVD